MDIGTTDYVAMAEAGAAMDVMNPAGTAPEMYDTGDKDADGKPIIKQVRIWLVGRDSDRWRKAQRELMDRITERSQKKHKMSGDESDAERCKILAAACLKWEGIFEDGKPLACTIDNAVKLFEKAPFIAEQVEIFIADRANFMKA